MRSGIRLVKSIKTSWIRRREALAPLKARSRLLARGIYVPASLELWHRLGTVLPPHLVITKLSAQNANEDDRRVPFLARVRTLTARLVATPPWVNFYLRGTADCTIATTTYEGGVLLLNPQRGSTLRTLQTAFPQEHYVRLRQRYGKHVPMPAFSIENGLLVEEYVHGSHLLEIPADEQVNAIDALLGAYSSLIGHDGELATNKLIALAYYAALAHPGSPPSLRSALASIDVGDACREWVHVPSGSDPSAKNILVSNDGTPIPIDLVELRSDPFFSYPIGAIARAGPAVRAHYAAGGYDSTLQKLFASAGVLFSGESTEREGWLAVRIALECYRKHYIVDAHEDARQLGELLTERWGNLHDPRWEQWE